MKDIIQILLSIIGGIVCVIALFVFVFRFVGPAISWLWDRRYRTWLFQFIEARRVIGAASKYVNGEMWEKLYELIYGMDWFNEFIHPVLVKKGERPKSGGLFMKDYLLFIKAVKDLDGYKEWLSKQDDLLI